MLRCHNCPAIITQVESLHTGGLCYNCWEREGKRKTRTDDV